MSQVVACPKCQKKYQVADAALGKQLKCPACQTIFIPANNRPPSRTGGAKPSQSTAAGTAMRPGADWAKHGLEGPLAPSPELFPPAPPNGPDPLANHVIEDPGFVDVDIEEIRKERVRKERKNRLTDPTAGAASLTEKSDMPPNYQYLGKDTLFGFKGRINRQRFWLSSILFSLLFGVIFAGVAFFIGTLLSIFGLEPPKQGQPDNGSGIVYLVLGIILWLISASFSFWVFFALYIKRLHDMNLSGYWSLLIALSPFAPLFALFFPPLVAGLVALGLNIPAFVAVIICGFFKGTDGRNQYGPDPLKYQYKG